MTTASTLVSVVAVCAAGARTGLGPAGPARRVGDVSFQLLYGALVMYLLYWMCRLCETSYLYNIVTIPIYVGSRVCEAER